LRKDNESKEKFKPLEKIKEFRIRCRKTLSNIFYKDRDKCLKCGGIYLYGEKGMTVCLQCGFKTEIVKKTGVEEIWRRDPDEHALAYFVLSILFFILWFILYYIALIAVGFL
jgi:hypothetical protein